MGMDILSNLLSGNNLFNTKDTDEDNFNLTLLSNVIEIFMDNMNHLVSDIALYPMNIAITDRSNIRSLEFYIKSRKTYDYEDEYKADLDECEEFMKCVCNDEFDKIEDAKIVTFTEDMNWSEPVIFIRSEYKEVEWDNVPWAIAEDLAYILKDERFKLYVPNCITQLRCMSMFLVCDRISTIKEVPTFIEKFNAEHSRKMFMATDSYEEPEGIYYVIVPITDFDLGALDLPYTMVTKDDENISVFLKE